MGLNPAYRIIDEGIGYRPQIARGVVHVSFGQNVHIGGTSNASFYWLFPLLDATIEVDGVAIMKDGKPTREVGGEMER